MAANAALSSVAGMGLKGLSLSGHRDFVQLVLLVCNWSALGVLTNLWLHVWSLSQGVLTKSEFQSTDLINRIDQTIGAIAVIEPKDGALL